MSKYIIIIAIIALFGVSPSMAASDNITDPIDFDGADVWGIDRLALSNTPLDAEDDAALSNYYYVNNPESAQEYSCLLLLR